MSPVLLPLFLFLAFHYSLSSSRSSLSASQVVAELVKQLQCDPDPAARRVGLVRVHLYRPFSARRFAEALPPTAVRVAVLDRNREWGSVGEPLFLDVLAALHTAGRLTRPDGCSYIPSSPLPPYFLWCGQL